MPRKKATLTLQGSGHDSVVYDRERELAFCLNPIAAQVLGLCDETVTVADARGRLGRPEDEASDLLALTLTLLSAQGLLADPIEANLTLAEFVSRWKPPVGTLPFVASVPVARPAPVYF